MKRVLAAVLLAGLPVCGGQPQAHERLRAVTQEGVRNLEKEFAKLLAPTPREKELKAARLTAAMNAVAARIREELDKYISRAVDPAHIDRGAVERDLKRILGPDDEEQPDAFVLESPRGRFLIVAYAFHKGTAMGPRGTSVTLRAYRATAARLELAGVERGDMDGYGRVALKELHSPVPGEVWLLRWGYMTGANGPNCRMRVYAFDGVKFRTVWMPANVWGNFSVQVTDREFTVTGPYYREDKERHDTYFLAPDGLYRK